MNAVRSRYIGLLYVAPAIVFVAVFVAYPLGRLAAKAASSGAG